MSEQQAQMNRLKTLLLELSVEFRPVVLSSGQPSDVYVDCKQTALCAEGAELLGALLYEKVLLIENRSQKTGRWRDEYRRGSTSDRCLVRSAPPRA